MASTANGSLTPEQEAILSQNKGPTVIAVSSLFIALSALSVCLRFVARVSRRMSFGIDDWLALGASIFVIIFCAICIITVPLGMGKHSSTVDPDMVWQIMHTAFFEALDYIIVHWFIKMSILAFYIRVFTTRIRWFKICVYTAGVYTTGWFIGCLFAAIFQCVPPALFWMQYNPASTMNGFCGVKYPSFVVISSALNTVGDVTIFCLPVAVLWTLQLRREQKFALLIVFATGALSIAASFIRLSQSLKAIQLNADTTWIMADLYMWTSVEAGVGLVCSCLPVIGPLFGLVGQRLSSYVSGRSSQNRYPTSTKPGNEVGGGRLIRDGINTEDYYGMPEGIMRKDSVRMESRSLREDDLAQNNNVAWKAQLESPV